MIIHKTSPTWGVPPPSTYRAAARGLIGPCDGWSLAVGAARSSAFGRFSSMFLSCVFYHLWFNIGISWCVFIQKLWFVWFWVKHQCSIDQKSSKWMNHGPSRGLACWWMSVASEILTRGQKLRMHRWLGRRGWTGTGESPCLPGQWR